jgi:uncharacterized protein (TIGR02246 family)
MAMMASNARELYLTLIAAWNNRDAAAMAACFSDEATMIGFDGSMVQGRRAIEDHLAPIFTDHPTAAFVTIIRRERNIDTSILLSADVGMIAPGKTQVMPDRNARQTLLARPHGGGWVVELFQNTPAALDQDPKERERLVKELNEVFSQEGRRPR